MNSPTYLKFVYAMCCGAILVSKSSKLCLASSGKGEHIVLGWVEVFIH